MRHLRWTHVVVAAVLAAVAGMAISGVWVFRRQPISGASLWELLFSDPTALGFARLVVIAFGAYAVASVPILVIRDRWIRSVGPGGVTVGEIERTDERFAELKAELEQAIRERDQAVGDWEALFEKVESGSIG